MYKQQKYTTSLPKQHNTYYKPNSILRRLREDILHRNNNKTRKPENTLEKVSHTRVSSLFLDMFLLIIYLASQSKITDKRHFITHNLISKVNAKKYNTMPKNIKITSAYSKKYTCNLNLT